MQDFVSFPKLGITLPVTKSLEIGTFSLRWYGIVICLGMVLCIILGLRFVKKYGLNADKILDYIIVAVPSAIVGARLYYVLFKLDYYLADPAKIVAIWEGGLAIYGGIIGALLAVLIMSLVRKDYKFLHLIDFALPYIALGQAVGRWGNFFNQEAYGTTTNLPWGMTGSEIGSTAVHPTFLYESLWCFAIFAFLVIYRSKIQKNFGEVTSLYMILYGLERAVVEGLRTDSLMINIGSLDLRVSQWLSVILLVIGIAFYIDSRRKGTSVSETIGATWPRSKKNLLEQEEVQHSKLYELVQELEEDSKETEEPADDAEEPAENLEEFAENTEENTEEKEEQ